jgi:hypothetical protein
MNSYQTLGTLLVDYFAKTAGWKQNIMIDWVKVVGRLSEYMSCERIDNKFIYARVYDYHLMQELFYMRSEIVASIARHYPQVSGYDMRFNFIGIKKDPIGSSIIPAIGSSNKEQRTIRAKEKEALDCVEDRELQECLKNFLIKCVL